MEISRNDRQTDIPTNRPKDRQTDMYRPTDKEDTLTHIYERRQTDRQTGTNRQQTDNRQTDRKTDRQTD